jgi:hypothetical protein
LVYKTQSLSLGRARAEIRARVTTALKELFAFSTETSACRA